MKPIVTALVIIIIYCQAADVQGQNVGIGTATPAYKLDIVGRLRLQQTGETAGIYFDGTSTPSRSFIGTYDNNHIGIYGSVTGWKFSLDVTNGNVGIGTMAPTATLDVAGGIRLRDNGVAPGAALHSSDALGNADWVNPVAFKVQGYSAGPFINFPHNSWQDINFGSGIAYNYGNGYSSATSEFTIPRRGIYNFKSQLKLNSTSDYFGQRLMLRRNGGVSVLTQTEYSSGYEQTVAGYTSLLDTEILLEPGDAVWIEANATDFDGTDSRQIYGNYAFTWFCGRLVVPL
jgi:hypothetical protein